MISIRNEALFNAARKCTEVHRKFSRSDSSEAEVAFLKAYLPLTLPDIEDEDLFAGQVNYRDFLLEIKLHGYGTEVQQQRGYCYNPGKLKELKRELGPEYNETLDEIDAYWQRNATVFKYERSYQNLPERHEVGDDYINWGATIRTGGVYLNFDLLLSVGICGLKERIIESSKASTEEKFKFYDCMLEALDLFSDCCHYYSGQARKLMVHAPESRKQELSRMAEALDVIAVNRPETFFQAVQLFWLYACISCLEGFGRMDVYLGDYLAGDLDKGLLEEEEEAIELLVSLWKRIGKDVVNADGRIILGGEGRRNPLNADRFALLAMEATRRVRGIVPALTLRLYKSLDERVMEKALQTVGEGCLYPMFYNDEYYINGIMNLLNIPKEDAMEYFPLGCGEMCLDHMGFGSPNSAFLVPKALEAVIYNGRTPDAKKSMGMATGELSEFKTFEQFLGAFEAQVVYAANIAARVFKHNYDAVEDEASYLFQSILFDDCISRGLGMMHGGARYKGGSTEGFGFTNAGDSLYAIKKTVFDEKIFTLEQMREMLKSNYEGYEKERKLLRDLPKYGNDIDEVDQMVVYVNRFVNKAVLEAGKQVGLDYYIISNVNPGGIEFGPLCMASADGRKDGEALAVGNSPTAGNDVSGMTRLLSSVAKVDPENGGLITNLKISSQIFKEHLQELKVLLNVFFKKGGLELNISVVNKGELEDALVHPEKYPDLMIRVGGWAARFIDLEPRYQKEIIARTGY